MIKIPSEIEAARRYIHALSTVFEFFTLLPPLTLFTLFMLFKPLLKHEIVCVYIVLTIGIYKGKV